MATTLTEQQIATLQDIASGNSGGNPIGDGTPILLTGHSLSGGLAGFVRMTKRAANDNGWSSTEQAA